MTVPFFSPVPLPEDVRERGVAVAQPVVDSGVALALVAQHAHWNVKGPSFGPLHALFGDLYDLASEVTDLLAERIVVLGGVANGLAVFGASPRVAAGAAGVSDGLAFCRMLAELALSYTAQAYPAVALLNQTGLIVDGNVYQDVLAKIEKVGWMLAAHVPDFKPVAAEPAPAPPAA